MIYGGKLLINYELNEGPSSQHKLAFTFVSQITKNCQNIQIASILGTQ